MQSCPELGQGEGDHFDGVEFRTRRLLRGSKRTSLERSETLRHVPNADIGSDCVWRLVACITLRPSPEAVLCRYLGAGSPNEHPTVKQLSVS